MSVFPSLRCSIAASENLLAGDRRLPYRETRSHSRFPSEETMPERPLPSENEVIGYIRERRNWGRWGKDDQVGALNLITPAKRVAATRLVKTGRSVSPSRPFPKEPGPNNVLPAQHFMK